MNEKCDCCTRLFDAETSIDKGGKHFCSLECLRSYAYDIELARIAKALEEIVGILKHRL